MNRQQHKKSTRFVFYDTNNPRGIQRVVIAKAPITVHEATVCINRHLEKNPVPPAFAREIEIYFEEWLSAS